MKEEKPCIICNQSIAANADRPEIWDKGNNAEPVATGQCCDKCNAEVVVARILALIKAGKAARIGRS